MKKCPYCAEEIQDEAIKCRYCFSDLTVPPGQGPTREPEPPAEAATAVPAVAAAAGTATEVPVTESSPAPSPGQIPAVSADTALRYSHSGYRYVLGYGADYFGIWERQSPSSPTERFARTDDGWRDAWLRFSSLEPNAVEVPGSTAPAAASPTAAPAASDDRVLRYTHSGSRYLLGYGEGFYGIWDRTNPTIPMERFPRTDQGWAEAWTRYTAIETRYAEVT